MSLKEKFGGVATPHTAQTLSKDHDPQDLWAEYDRIRAGFLPPWTRRAQELLDGLTEAVAEEVRTVGRPASILDVGATDMVADVLRRRREEIRSYLQELYIEVGRPFAEEGYRRVRDFKAAESPEEAADQWISEVDEWLRQEGGTSITGITETTRDDITSVIAEGAEEGVGSEELARRIEDEVGDINRVRARRIARTEIITASNRATQAGAQASGLELVKEWVATSDSRTRNDHIAMDGRLVGMNSTFTLPDGSTAKYPGDPSLPARQRVNCRCAVAHVRKDEADLGSNTVLT